MPVDEKLIERVEKALHRKRGITQKKMFGGICFLHNGNMLCGVDNKSRLMVRVGPEKYEAALKRKHARKMDFTGKPMKGMIYVDSPGVKSVDLAKKWIEFAMEFTKTLPHK